MFAAAACSAAALGQAPPRVAARAKSEFAVYTDSDAVTVMTPAVTAAVNDPLAGWSATGTYLADIVSAASVDVVSTASPRWEEVRHAGGLEATYQPDRVRVTASGSASREPDYLSLSGGAAFGLDLAGKTANPTLSYSYTHDTAGRSGTPFSVFSLELVRHVASAGIELVLDPTSVLLFGVDGIHESGDAAKPYRFVPLFAPAVAPEVPRGASVEVVNQLRLPGRVAERVPRTRNRLAVSARFAQRLPGSTLVASERLYADDWGLEASTTDVRFVFDVSRRFFPWVHLRGHFQSGVAFWQRAYVATSTGQATLVVPEFRTGDRESSPLGTGTFGGGVRWDIGSEPRPGAMNVAGHADFGITAFSDALFVSSREAFLAALQWEVEF